MTTIITYYIVEDREDKLSTAAAAACGFWNAFLTPNQSVIIRLDTFEEHGTALALAYRPYNKDGTKYGHVSFNERTLHEYSTRQLTEIMIHELAHSLGIGFKLWHKLFDIDTGRFYPEVIKKLPALGDMSVELEGGPGTRFFHWDAEQFKGELMSGYYGGAYFVLPTTIEVMKLFGHQLKKRLNYKVQLEALLKFLAEQGSDDGRSTAKELGIDTSWYEATPLFEEIAEPPSPESDPSPSFC